MVKSLFGNKISTTMPPGDRMETELLDEMIRDLELMRQRHVADLSLLRQVMHDKARLAQDISALQDKREHWMQEKAELEDRLQHLESLVSRRSGIEINDFCLSAPIIFMQIFHNYIVC